MGFLFDRSKRRSERHLKSPGEKLKLSERGSFLYAASLHNNRYGIYYFLSGVSLRMSHNQSENLFCVIILSQSIKTANIFNLLLMLPKRFWQGNFNIP